MNRPSETAQKISGYWIEDGPPPAGVTGWIQNECRRGSLTKFVAEFCKAQPELLDPERLCVLKSGEVLECVIPAKVSDHEGLALFLTHVELTLDPNTGKITRL